MNANDLVSVMVAFSVIFALVALTCALMSLNRASRELPVTVDRFDGEAERLALEMHKSVLHAGAEVERVDDLIDAASSIQHTVDSASRLTYVAFSKPLIKVVAVARGLGRGIERVFGAGGRRRRRLESRRHERDSRRPGREAA
jgi:hypothetical protein